MRSYDLNVFFRDEWTKEDGESWSDNLFIDVYVYEEAPGISCQHEQGILIETTVEETAEILKYYPENEYGSDWWVDATIFMETCPPRIRELLESLPDVYNLELDKEPSWYITKDDNMLF